MSAAAIAAIDWSRPWLQSLRDLGAPLASQVAAGQSVWAALQSVLEGGAVPALAGWSFVPQAALPAGQAYEQFIAATRCIPTRDHLHDFFNGLIWLHWPRMKTRLNALQAAAIARDGVGARRGPVRDAITVWDENGALLIAPQPLVEALHERQWQRLMVELRPQWAQARLWPVGHALLEQLVQPYKSICAHVLAWPGASAGPGGAGLCTEMGLADRDAALSDWLAPEVLVPKPFAPLPVLGVPGWWAENTNFSFYDDSFVFRSARPSKSA